MKIIITESQYLTLLIEEKKSKEIEGCTVFKDINLREFCKSVESHISENLSEYSPYMESLIKTYFSSNKRISKIQMEELNNESDIVKNGLDEIDEVVKDLSKNCPNAENIAKELREKWMSKYNVYFKDGNGNYHLINRLNTNYTAMAVLVTFFYEDLIEQVRTWTTRQKTPSKFFIENWVDHFFYPNVQLIDPRKGIENDKVGENKKLVKTPNKILLLNKILNPQEFKVEKSEYHDNFMRALVQVREKGFQTEQLFENMLKDNKIVYKKYNYDYSFVDMILGIDFLIKQMRDNSDYWVPVQVKSTFREKYNLIDKFKCTKVIKPELSKVNDKYDFEIGGIRGFEEYFCKEHSYCRKKEKEKVYAPLSVDYFSSREGKI